MIKQQGADKDWIQTFTGRHFYPFNPKAEDIDILDIAHALSLQCRFTGHVQKFYSVGQHSLLVSDLCLKDDKLYGLLHDASEAYLTDVARPVKHHPNFSLYRIAEAQIMEKVWERFGLSKDVPASVHVADEEALSIEARCLMGSIEGWEGLVPTTREIIPISPGAAEKTFLAVFNRFYEKR